MLYRLCTVTQSLDFFPLWLESKKYDMESLIYFIVPLLTAL